MLAATSGSATGPTVSPAIRRLTKAISLLAVVVGPLLFLLPDRTDTLFAWTINPPLTAAFLGAAYCTALVIELLAARERIWSRARVVYPAMLLFTTFTLVATLLHMDKFHFAASGFLARFTAWAWLIIYVLAPPAMLVLLLDQLRSPGADVPKRASLPAWLRALLGVQGAVMLVLGAALFVAPSSVSPIWPWTLTPLTAQAVAAWLIGLGFAAAHSFYENDLERTYITMAGNAAFGVLQLIALLRFTGAVNWTAPNGWIYAAFLIALVAMGLYGWYAARRHVAPTAYDVPAGRNT
jgi:hypothetical protein